MFQDLIVELDPPPNRRGKLVGEKERHLTEAAVMLAYGLNLFATVAKLAGHADPRTTWLYDRRERKITRNIVERISV